MQGCDLWDMLQFNSHKFVHLTQSLTDIQHDSEKQGDDLIDENHRDYLRRELRMVLEDCHQILCLPTSVVYVIEILQLLDQEWRPIHYKNIGQHVGNLRDTIRRELQSSFSLTLSPLEAEHYRNFRKDWEKIIDRFPRALGDIEEARKCFALNRYAASVFHSTQIVEFALLELGKFIKINDPKSGWTAVTNALKKIVNKDHEDRTVFERKHYPFIEQVYGTVEALKNAWRNKVSHAQGRLVLLTTDFTPGIAEEILFATRSFTSRLASGLPASKNPKPRRN